MGEARSIGRGNIGVSPVIATIILSAIVITVGAAVWNYSQGATTIIANDYINGTMELLKEVTERFNVEHVSNNSDGSLCFIWVYNYGNVDIIVDVYANATHYVNSTYSEHTYSTNLTNSIVSMSLFKINISYASNPLEAGDSVAIKVHSRRQNNAFYTYIAH